MSEKEKEAVKNEDTANNYETSSQKLEKRLDEIQKLIESNDKYKNQFYGDESLVTIKGKDFADLLSVLLSTRAAIIQLSAGLNSAFGLSENMIDFGSPLMVTMMEKHIQNIEDGITDKIEKSETKKK